MKKEHVMQHNNVSFGKSTTECLGIIERKTDQESKWNLFYFVAWSL